MEVKPHRSENSDAQSIARNLAGRLETLSGGVEI